MEKNQFNLRDLMMEFRISKRTALRDVSELEALGVPLYAKSRKNGGTVSYLISYEHQFTLKKQNC